MVAELMQKEKVVPIVMIICLTLPQIYLVLLFDGLKKLGSQINVSKLTFVKSSCLMASLDGELYYW